LASAQAAGIRNHPRPRRLETWLNRARPLARNTLDAGVARAAALPQGDNSTTCLATLLGPLLAHTQHPTVLRLIGLRGLCNELAWIEQLPELAHLIRREDIPRLPQRLPRPLTAEQDELLQQEFRVRNDLGGNVFLLIRHTGMRIGECADLSSDCLHSTGPNQWAIHVPLGKLKTERMVPVDPFVCEFVHRLRFFRSLDPLPADGRLLARPGAQDTLLRHFRD